MIALRVKDGMPAIGIPGSATEFVPAEDAWRAAVSQYPAAKPQAAQADLQSRIEAQAAAEAVVGAPPGAIAAPSLAFPPSAQGIPTVFDDFD